MPTGGGSTNEQYEEKDQGENKKNISRTYKTIFRHMVGIFISPRRR